MSFIESFEQYQRICKIQNIEATESNYQEITEITNSILETPEQKRYVQEDLNELWKEYIKENPDVTLDMFLESMAEDPKQ